MSVTIMSSLFRPWAAEEKITQHYDDDLIDIRTKTSPTFDHVRPINYQDATVSTTTTTPFPENLPQSSQKQSKLATDNSATKSDERLRKSTKHQELLEKRNRKRINLNSRKTSKSEPCATTFQTPTSMTHSRVIPHYDESAWNPHNKSSNISSGNSSAFHPQMPSIKNFNSELIHQSRLGLHPSAVGEPLPYGCSDVSYVTNYYCPDLSVDLLTSELALESALLRGIMPSPAQMEEYAKLLQMQEQNLKGMHRKQRPKKYRCPHCQVAFSNNGQLKGHVRIHTGERPYKCDVTSCAKTFTRNEELTRHKRIHSGLRPYACATCGKRFGRKDHLKKHARTHQPQYHRQALMVPILPPLGHPYPYLYGL